MVKLRTLAVIVGMALVSTALADELEAVEKRIAAGWEQHKSMTAKLTMETHMEMGGMVIEGQGQGLYEFLRKGEKLLSRTELQNDMVQRMGEQENKTSQSTTVVMDGDYAYTLSSQTVMGQKTTMAMKTDIDPQMSGDPKSVFVELRKDHTLKLLPEEDVAGEKTYVIEATPKEQAAAPGRPTRMVLYFNQKHGYMAKMMAYGLDDKPMQTMLFSDVKFDVDFQPERFVFKAPEGVQVIDQTGQKP